MRRLFILSFVVLFALVGVSDGMGKPRKRRKKTLEDDPEYRAQVLDQMERDLPGFWRWWGSFRAGQLKVTRIDTTKAPNLELHFSILRNSKSGLIEPVTDGADLVTLDLLLTKAEEGPAERILTIADGDPESIEGTEETPAPPVELLTMAEAEIPLDVMVVAAGHAGFKDVEQLEGAHQAAVSKIVTKLEGARGNIFWYGSMLRTYRAFPGFTKELSRYDENLRQCEVDRMMKMRQEGRELDEGEEELPPPPCGLHPLGDVKSGLSSAHFRSKQARLFAIDRTGIFPCDDTAYESTALRDLDTDAIEERTVDAGAFEEALRLLVRYGREGSRKAIIVVGDGRDGYVDEQSVCQDLFVQSKAHCAGVGQGKNLKAREIKAALNECVQRKLNERATTLQQRWAPRAQLWISLARAANIQVYSIAYSLARSDKSMVSYDYERERLELLAHKTGGTYREVYLPAQAEAAAESLVDELNSARVLRVGGVLASDTKYNMGLEATIRVRLGVQKKLKDGKEVDEVLWAESILRSRPYTFAAPLVESGFWHTVSEWNRALKEKVGVVLYWVIVVLAVLLLLFILYLIFKLFKALVMKIVKAASKKGKDAAKGAAKGAK